MRYSAVLLSGCLWVFATSALSEDTFVITASNGVVFDNETAGARVVWATAESWSFSAGLLTMRIEGARMGNDPAVQTEELIGNNTGFSFMTEIDGEQVPISCRLGQDEIGFLERTELTETRVSGNFRIELVRCLDYYTASPVEYDDLPIIVEGVFSVDR